MYDVHAAAGAEFVERDGWAVPVSFQSPVDEFKALREAVGLVDLTGWGVLRLRGSSRLDFVQRLSTNDVLRLTPAQGAATIFTTPIGRIVDLAFVLVREEELLLIVGRGADEIVADWLRRHIFFNDDVVVDNLTGQWGLVGCSGPGAAAPMARLLGEDLRDLPPFHASMGQFEGVDVTVVRSVPLGNEYLLMIPAEQASVMWTALARAVESAGGAFVGETALEAARMAGGWPRFGRELSEDYIPLEAGLKWAVNFNKGCYVGQEIIARMDTYQRLAKRLVVLGWDLRSSGPIYESAKTAGEKGLGAEWYVMYERKLHGVESVASLGQVVGEELVVGEEVWADDSQVGQVTSVAQLADRGVVSALAYVKTSVAELGHEVTIVAGDNRLKATVLAVPGES
jgi:aminomethyltransferase